MNEVVLESRVAAHGLLDRLLRPWSLIWLSVLGATLVFAYTGRDLAPWAFKYPRAWQLTLKKDIGDFMKWLVNDATFGLFTFKELTRSIAWVLEWPLNLASSLLSTGFLEGQGSDAVQVTPPLSWLAVIFVLVAMARYAKDWRLAALVGGCFLYLAMFGQWASAMVTLSSIVIAVPIGAAGGLLIGIAGYRSPWVERVIKPVLDLMQTVPIFAYLVPILFLFGFGPVAAMIATIIYAMPPMVRVTMLALRAVPSEIEEFGRMAGCTGRQMLWRVLVPSAMPSLMVGVNQVIMLSLNMVIIASMIGAGGLGFEVLSSLRRLNIGQGVEAGIAIVVLAIALDRLSQAYAHRELPPYVETDRRPWVQRHPYTVLSLAFILVSGLIGLVLPAVQSYPEALQITTGPYWGQLVEYINVNFFDQLEAIKTFLLLNVMVPVKRFLLMLPWVGVAALLGLAGWQLGGWRLALLVVLLCVFIVVNGLWAKAMVTVYLVGISVVIASLIGMPIGIWAAENERVGRVVQVIIDTLQTLPSFVYLIPVVMLFRVGDFSAMIAVVAYALAPAIRYTAHGIRQLNPQLLEAGVSAGCTRWQLLWKIKLPLALPEIMLGVNQTIMLAISMLVITALVGTRDLGQEVYIALTKADTGRGVVAGLCVAFIAIIADRLIAAWAERRKRELGME
ncbi:MAG: ABC transporter permease subunit [Pseudomonadota bacterium]